MREVNAAERRHVSGGAAGAGFELPSGANGFIDFRPKILYLPGIWTFATWIASVCGDSKPIGLEIAYRSEESRGG
ncbi:hypothetical protein [Burkholderia stagnalis]